MQCNLGCKIECMVKSSVETLLIPAVSIQDLSSPPKTIREMPSIVKMWQTQIMVVAVSHYLQHHQFWDRSRTSQYSLSTLLFGYNSSLTEVLATAVMGHHVRLTNQDGVSTVNESGNLFKWAFTVGLMQVKFSWVPLFHPSKTYRAPIPTHSVNVHVHKNAYHKSTQILAYLQQILASHGKSWKALIFVNCDGHWGVSLQHLPSGKLT